MYRKCSFCGARAAPSRMLVSNEGMQHVLTGEPMPPHLICRKCAQQACQCLRETGNTSHFSEAHKEMGSIKETLTRFCEAVYPNDGQRQQELFLAIVAGTSEKSRIKTIELYRQCYENMGVPPRIGLDTMQQLVDAEEFEDGEVIGRETDGTLICWNSVSKERYNCGQTLEQFGLDDLTDKERQRLGV